MKKIFLDMDGTIARFNVRNALNRFKTEQDFFKNLLAYKNIEKINEMAKNGNVYIISASPNLRADIAKLAWVSVHLPNINLATNVWLCRLGENKADYLKSKGFTIDRETFLLDDYTKNLIEWENAGGVGIKRLTKVADNSRKLWKGLELKDLKELESLVG